MLLSRHICNLAKEIRGRHRRGCWAVCCAEEVTKHLQLPAGVLRAAGVASARPAFAPSDPGIVITAPSRTIIVEITALSKYFPLYQCYCLLICLGEGE